MTKDEHLAWAKVRALEYVALGNLLQAVSSMVSDMAKHPEIDLPSGVRSPALADGLRAAAHDDRAAVQAWIEGWELAS